MSKACWYRLECKFIFLWSTPPAVVDTKSCSHSTHRKSCWPITVASNSLTIQKILHNRRKTPIRGWIEYFGFIYAEADLASHEFNHPVTPYKCAMYSRWLLGANSTYRAWFSLVRASYLAACDQLGFKQRVQNITASQSFSVIFCSPYVNVNGDGDPKGTAAFTRSASTDSDPTFY